LARLARLLCRRARATDEIGWFEPGRLGVVLPDTSADGALAFVRDFTESANYRGFSPICNVLSYRGQAHSDNERLSVEQVARAIDAEGQDFARVSRDIPPRSHRRFSPMRPVDPDELSSLLVRPLPWWKRVTDVLLGGAILAAALPVMAVVALVVKISDRGPVLYKQRRAGLGGKPFTICKFRTMVVDADAKKRPLKHKSEQDGPAFKIKHDPRITRVGRFLRETSLDELPQLFNVLVGDMTLVGPRPLPMRDLASPAPGRHPRLDLHLAGSWPLQRQLHRMDSHGPALHPAAVHLAGREADLDDHSIDVVAPRPVERVVGIWIGRWQAKRHSLGLPSVSSWAWG
jgi:lipopolysaccharide/colanic/teichoic acid biosynthesis glycosyltransferase